MGKRGVEEGRIGGGGDSERKEREAADSALPQRLFRYKP